MRKAKTETDVLRMATMSRSSIKKLMEGETEKILTVNHKEVKRKQQLKKLIKANSLPEIVTSRKTTSAIFRDFRQLKQRNEDKCRTLGDTETRDPFSGKVVLPAIPPHSSVRADCCVRDVV